MRDAMPQFWLWTMIGFLAFGVIYWWYAANELEKQKSAVMARQRAFAVKLGPQLYPVRDKVEAWTTELAGDFSGNVIHPKLSLEQLSTSRGAYLRLKLSDAKDVDRLRLSADKSLHDGFTSCLFVREARKANDGAACANSGECASGEICNEYDRCAAPTQPYNMRLMYRALRVLSSTWTDELHQATSDYKVRIFDRDLDAVAKTDVPVALELTARAKYFTVLLDEMPESGLPEVAGVNTKGGLEESEMEQLQTLPHPVRLGVWDLESGELLVRLRTDAGATFLPIGSMASAPLSSQRARQRQVNNCSIAESLREAVDRRAPKAPEVAGTATAVPPGASAPSAAVPDAVAAPTGVRPAPAQSASPAP
jgi:hypothetical protein